MEPRQGSVVVLVFVVALTALAAFGAAFEVPIPAVHDEFAYLLTGDTFADGRLTNPTHPSWEHFDTFHVFHHPTYQGKYPPGQGAFLALGQAAFGEPAYGVWLSLALGFAAVAWMLAAIVPPSWAALGPLLLLAQASLFRSWGQTYWGGAVALLGGALFFGALLRLRHQPRPALAAILGLGVFLLANTRPAEGALVVLLSTPLLVLAWRRARARGESVRGTSAVFAASILVLALWTALYNATLTGDVWRMPYENWDKYESPHELIQWYAGSPEISLMARLGRLQRFFCGPVLVFLLPLLWLRRREPFVLPAIAIVAVAGVVSVATTRGWPHYLAPVTGIMAFLLVESLRALAGLRGGAWLAGVAVLLHVGIGALPLARAIRNGPPPSWHRERDAIERELVERGGEHLVLVRYREGHLIHEEWVFNAADIDGAPVVWARELGPEKDAALLQHFAGRSVWRVQPRAPGPSPATGEPATRERGTRLEPYGDLGDAGERGQ